MWSVRKIKNPFAFTRQQDTITVLPQVCVNLSSFYDDVAHRDLDYLDHLWKQLIRLVDWINDIVLILIQKAGTDANLDILVKHHKDSWMEVDIVADKLCWFTVIFPRGDEATSEIRSW